MGQEQRAYPRVVVGYGVSIETPGGIRFEGTVENLGGLGALVSTPDLEAVLDVGDEVSMTISTADKGDVAVSGQVLRLEQEFTGGDIRRTFAVKFDRELSF